MKLSPIFACLIVIPWVTIGCEQPPLPHDASTARDSGGVRIVENSLGAAWSTAWEVATEPLLTVGSIDGDQGQVLFQVTGAVGMTGGGFVVANAGRYELLFYDGDGRFMRRAGRRGGGPGEFLSLEWVTRYGPDSILTVDVRAHRVSYFDNDGNFGRSVRLEPGAQIPFPRPVGVFADGGLLATQGTFSLGGDPPIRALRTQVPLFRYEPDGSTATLVGSFQGPEWVVVPTGRMRSLERRRRPFGRETVFAAAGDRFYVADNETYEIRAYTLAGRLMQVIRKSGTPLPVEDSDIRVYEDSALAGADAFTQAQLRLLFDSQPPAPQTYPAYAPDILVDSDMNLWVRESSRLGDERSKWSVFTDEGELLGEVDMPPGLRVLDIGTDYVLGLQRDELDVEYIQKYPLRRTY
jgi:hypothetical protein